MNDCESCGHPENDHGSNGCTDALALCGDCAEIICVWAYPEGTSA